MKLKNVLLTLGLATSVITCAFAFSMHSYSENPVVEASADNGDVWYLRGTMNSWTGNDDYKIIEGSEPTILTFSAGDKFKVVNHTTNWEDGGATVLTEGLGDATSSGKFSFSYGADTYVNTAGTYAISVKGGKVYADFVNYYYSGTDNSWGITADADHPEITINGEPVTFNLTSGETFKIRNENWDYGVFGYSNLADKDFYGSFYGEDNGNIVCKIAGSYDVSVSMSDHTWTIRAYPHGVNPDETAFVYVLDKYGSLLHENHYAYISSTVGYTTGTPGAIMESYPDTNHMYQQEFWTGMQTVEFNNNSGWSWKWDISVDGEWTNRGKCLILDDSTDGDGKWSSNVWVEPATAKFIENCMHFANYNEQQQGDGYCVSAGWYDTAVSAYEALEEKYQKEICSLPDVLERLQKWAIANEEHFVVTDGVGAFGSSVTPVLGFLNNSDNNATAMIVVTVTFVSMVGVAGFFFIRRHKEQ